MDNFRKYLSFAAFIFLLLNTLPAYSAPVIGEFVKITGNDDSSYPLMSGVTQKFDNDAAISFNGARIKAVKGSVITPFDGGEKGFLVRIDEGKLVFRIFPEKSIFTIVTPQAVIKTPRIVNTANTSIEGTVAVSQKDRTVLHITNGEVELRTSRGERKVGEKQIVTIAQADVSSDEHNEHYTTKNDEDGDDRKIGILPPVLITTAVAGGVTGAVILSDDNDNDGVGQNPASNITP